MQLPINDCCVVYCLPRDIWCSGYYYIKSDGWTIHGWLLKKLTADDVLCEQINTSKLNAKIIRNSNNDFDTNQCMIQLIELNNKSKKNN